VRSLLRLSQEAIREGTAMPLPVSGMLLDQWLELNAAEGETDLPLSTVNFEASLRDEGLEDGTRLVMLEIAWWNRDKGMTASVAAYIRIRTSGDGTATYGVVHWGLITFSELGGPYWVRTAVVPARLLNTVARPLWRQMQKERFGTEQHIPRHLWPAQWGGQQPTGGVSGTRSMWTIGTDVFSSSV
jgi:hypothetical protein